MISIEVTRQMEPTEWETALLGGIEDGMPGVAEVLREDAVRCFDEERDPWGRAWKALQAATIRARERLRKAGKILNRDGILKGSIAGSPLQSTPGVMRATVAPGGAASAYAATHQFGDADRGIEARAYLPIRPGGEVDLPDALRTEIIETIRDAIRLRIGRQR